MPRLSDRVGTFTDSVIRRMTRISDQYGAINLSQGFPDFDPPRPMLDRLAQVAYEGPHQYSVTFGAKNLRDALAEKQGCAIGRAIDPDKEIVVRHDDHLRSRGQGDGLLPLLRELWRGRHPLRGGAHLHPPGPAGL